MLKRILFYLLLLSPLLLLPPTAMATTLPNQANSTLARNFSAYNSPHLLANLLDKSAIIAVGHVTTAQSRWDQTHMQIETDYTLRVHDLLSSEHWNGKASGVTAGQLIQITAEGGYLAEEGIGLWAVHEATFQLGETALLFLAPPDAVVNAAVTTGERRYAQFQVVQGELGKFTFNHGFLVNHAGDVQLAVTDFAQQISQTLANRGDPSVNQQQILQMLVQAAKQSADQSSAPDFPLAAMDDLPRWGNAGLELDVKVNINSAQIDEQRNSSGEFFMAIQRAMKTWSQVPSTNFTILYDGETAVVETGFNGENEIVFVHKGANKALGQAQIWYTADNIILEVDIWLNDDYPFSVTGEPRVGETDLESVVLHELGHWAPLSHSNNPDSVMYSVLGAMEMKRALHADDINMLMQLYPCDLPPCIHEIYRQELATPTPHPTPTVTPTPTLVSTAATPPPDSTQLPTGIDRVYLPYVTR